VRFEISHISTVICWNGKTPTGPAWFGNQGIYSDLVAAARAQNWGATDLFPAFGMPSFPLSIKIPRPIPRQ
jgi:hypothetical protein